MMPLLAEAAAPTDLESVFWMVVAGLITTLVGVGTKILKAWGDAQVAKIKNDDLRGQVALAKNEIGDVVYMISQVLVPEVKAAAADGKVSKEERERLLARAVELARERFSADFWTDLMGRLGIPPDRLDEWIVGQVEARVFRMKMERPPAADPSGGPKKPGGGLRLPGG